MNNNVNNKGVDYEYGAIDYFDSLASGSASYLAVQQWMGLLSVGRPRTHFTDRPHIGAHRQNVESPPSWPCSRAAGVRNSSLSGGSRKLKLSNV